KYCSWHGIQGCKCVANHWVDCIKTECDERGCIADSSNAKLSQYGEGLANGSKRCDEEAKQRDAWDGLKRVNDRQDGCSEPLVALGEDGDRQAENSCHADGDQGKLNMAKNFLDESALLVGGLDENSKPVEGWDKKYDRGG